MKFANIGMMRIEIDHENVQPRSFAPELDGSYEIRSMRDKDSYENQSVEMEIQPLLKNSTNEVHFLKSELHKIINLLIKHISVAIYFIFRFALPITSVTFLLVQCGNHSLYYTFAQKALILTTSISMMVGFKYCLLQRIFRYQERSGTILFIVVTNYIVWDKLHGEDFFDFPSSSRDLVYSLNYYEFYIMLMVNMFTILAWVAILIMVAVYLIWRVLAKRIKTEREKRILSNLRKSKFSVWKQQSTEQLGLDSGMAGEKDCCICCQKINDESFIAVLPSCGHVFHHQCVLDWLKINPICPFCRDNVARTLRREANLSQSYEELPN